MCVLTGRMLMVNQRLLPRSLVVMWQNGQFQWRRTTEVE